MQIVIIAIIFLADVLLVAAAAYFATRYLNEKFRKEQQNSANNTVLVAKEKARAIELEAKDKELNLLQEAEGEITRRRSELAREEDRLQKRRAELDHRMEKNELREQVLNKRQSSLDKRSNDLEKAYSTQLEELQRIAQMTMEEARTVLLAEEEKEAR